MKIPSPSKPYLIAGPCSAESLEQVLQIAEQIKSYSQLFRAGIWKPRTRPGGFEGVGEIGLQWLQEVKKQTQLPLAVEVATAHHVEKALEYGVDVLWIGARTTVNPFAVQEIADALQGVKKPVMIKNPVNPDVALWAGGVERLQKAGVEEISLIHRGFSTYEKTIFRNTPEWQIALDIKSLFPQYPLICDPSHIAGNRNLIAEVSQTALDLNFDGLMIETHNCPDKAWSDSAQQVTPETLWEIYQNLKVRDLANHEEQYVLNIKNYRNQIDALDTKIIHLLNQRMEIVDKIGDLKKNKNVAVFQQERWAEVLQKMTAQAEKNQLGEEFITALYKAIHQESITRQSKIVNQK
ncbi:chorismate mutase [Capnocytophaga sp. ARDL2]|uniref:chorismate mutase n=1 Tax=Capnocytophaga sp. ARDL2 TaxID=3238809 RepID=UPI003557C339